MIFQYFATPAIYQHRVLFWGIVGALVMRAIFIATGAVLLESFHWMIYVFGAFLIVTGIKIAVPRRREVRARQKPGGSVVPALGSHHQHLPRATVLCAQRRKDSRDDFNAGVDCS